jgi:hypothetical protein
MLRVMSALVWIPDSSRKSHEVRPLSEVPDATLRRRQKPRGTILALAC